MRFTAGSVLGRALETTFKNFLPFFVLTLIVSAPVLVLEHMWEVPGHGTVAEEEIRLEDLRGARHARDPRLTSRAAVLGLLNLVTQGVAAGALSYGVFQSLRGKPAGIGDCLARGFSRIFPIIGISIVTALGVGFGMVLLIVPGIMIACAWYVAVPVAAVEQVGVGASLGRSGNLTRGNRTAIFVLFLLVLGLAFLVAFVLVGAFAAMGPLVGLVLTAFIGVFATLLGGVLQAVAYHDLRVVKEGVSTEEMLKVFE
jgi:hypothetical protein